MTENNMLEPITAELIQRLRYEGKFSEAQIALNAYRADIERNRREGKIRNKRLENKEKAIKRIVKGVCVDCGNGPLAPTSTRYCTLHLMRHNKYYRKKK